MLVEGRLAIFRILLQEERRTWLRVFALSGRLAFGLMVVGIYVLLGPWLACCAGCMGWVTGISIQMRHLEFEYTRPVRRVDLAAAKLLWGWGVLSFTVAFFGALSHVVPQFPLIMGNPPAGWQWQMLPLNLMAWMALWMITTGIFLLSSCVMPLLGSNSPLIAPMLAGGFTGLTSSSMLIRKWDHDTLLSFLARREVPVWLAAAGVLAVLWMLAIKSWQRAEV